jgi:double-stranded uracil-DNA glycosylase
LSRGRSFPPVADPATRVLILGSLPGAKSLAAQQYYAHPQNGFWRLAGGLINVDLAALAYPDRLAALLAHRIGLWDVIDEATRAGSLDAAIRDHRPNDLARLIAALPDLRAVGFNGKTAARLGRKALADVQGGLALIDLPSSSPALTTPLARKAEAWAVLGAFLA